MVLPQAMAWVQYWFRVLSLKFCGKSKKKLQWYITGITRFLHVCHHHPHHHQSLSEGWKTETVTTIRKYSQAKRFVTSKTVTDCALLRPDVERHHCFGAWEGLETQWHVNHIDNHTTPHRSSSRWKSWERQSPPCNGSRTTWRFSAAIGLRSGRRRMEALWSSERPGWAIHPWPQIFLGTQQTLF